MADNNNINSDDEDIKGEPTPIKKEEEEPKSEAPIIEEESFAALLSDKELEDIIFKPNIEVEDPVYNKYKFINKLASGNKPSIVFPKGKHDEECFMAFSIFASDMNQIPLYYLINNGKQKIQLWEPTLASKGIFKMKEDEVLTLDTLVQKLQIEKKASESVEKSSDKEEPHQDEKIYIPKNEEEYEKKVKDPESHKQVKLRVNTDIIYVDTFTNALLDECKIQITVSESDKFKVSYVAVEDDKYEEMSEEDRRELQNFRKSAILKAQEVMREATEYIKNSLEKNFPKTHEQLKEQLQHETEH